MKYDRIILAQSAKQYGYVIDTFEKVARLVDILKFIFEHPILKNLFALKGGTAINLFFMNLPRLSVDIDLDYMINDTLNDTKRNREIIKRIILSFIESNDYELHKRSKYNHNLDSYVLSYMNSSGNRDIIKIEINYSLRSHILAPVEMALKLEMFSMETKVVLLDPVEIYASKINALCSRAAARDLYDVDTMITSNFIKDTEMLRKCVVFYAILSNNGIDNVFCYEQIEMMPFSKIKRDLLPVLSDKGKFDLEAKKERIIQYFHCLMQLTQDEQLFIQAFKNGRYQPELLFEDKEIIKRIQNHPLIKWKLR